MILNKTTKHNERYRIIAGSMGNHGEPASSPNNKYEIARGINHGGGYQGYMAVTYFLAAPEVPEEAKRACRRFLRSKGYEV
jgi:hypothetical protein